jgi:hypothetical protein
LNDAHFDRNEESVSRSFQEAIANSTSIEEIFRDFRREDTDTFAAEIAAMINNGNNVFLNILNEDNLRIRTGRSFFMIKACFETALPYFTRWDDAIPDAVLSLYKECNGDALAHHLLNAFSDFLVANPLLVNDSQEYLNLHLPDSDILSWSLISAKLKLDQLDTIEILTQFLKHTDQNLQIYSFSALLTITTGYSRIEDAYQLATLFSKSCQNDRSLSAGIRALSKFVQIDKASLEDLQQVVMEREGIIGDHSLLAIAELFASLDPKITNDKSLPLIRILGRAIDTRNDIADYIDMWMYSLLNDDSCELLFLSIDSLDSDSTNKIDISNLRSTSYGLVSNSKLLERATIKWLTSSNYENGERLSSLLNVVSHESDLELVSDTTLSTLSEDQLLLLCGRLVGFLLLRPRIYVPILLRATNITDSESVNSRVHSIFVDFIIPNYATDTLEMMKKLRDGMKTKTKELIDSMIKNGTHYLEGMRLANTIDGLQPSEAQRISYRRHSGSVMKDAVKNIKHRSVFAELIPVSVILYGKRSVHYVSDYNNHAARTEIEMHSFGTQISIPMLEIYDPLFLKRIHSKLRLRGLQ